MTKIYEQYLEAVRLATEIDELRGKNELQVLVELSPYREALIVQIYNANWEPGIRVDAKMYFSAERTEECLALLREIKANLKQSEKQDETWLDILRQTY